tara:strand:+ start:172 stop:765 length:594 start_codon:yes stop_codon:yes gene_type:complete
MSQNQELRAETAQDIRLKRELEKGVDTVAGRAKIIETFAEIQEAEAKGETQPSWENDENQEEYNFIFRNGQEFNVIAPTLEFAKKQCQLWLEDPMNPKGGDDWEIFDVEITELEEVKDRFYKAPVMGKGDSETIVAALPNESEEFKKAFEAEDEEDKKHYFKILEDSEGNVIGEVEVDAEGNELNAKPAKKSKKSKK